MSQVSAGLPWFVVSVFVVGFLPGVLLVVAGRRGRRVDDHPVCRGCGFDLFGTHEPIPEKHPKCPECGTRREPRIGNRKRRGKLVLAGAMLMLASLGVAGVWGYGRFGAAQIAHYKPVWLLRVEARSGTSGAADAALHELLDRFQNGKLTAATADQLMADAVAHGPAGNAALTHAPLGSTWDSLAAELMKAGHGTDAQRVAIGRSWVELAVVLRSRVRQGHDVPMDIGRTLYGPPGPHQASMTMTGGVIRHRGIERTLHFNGGGGGSATRGSGTSGGTSSKRLVLSKELPAHLELGRHALEIELPITLSDGWSGPVWATWTQTVTVDFESVGREGDAIGLIHDPAAAGQLEKGVSVHDQQIVVSQGQYAQITLEFDKRPSPFAYQVFLRLGDRRWPFCTVQSEARPNGGLSASTGGKVPDELQDGALVDLVFEPDADVARGTTDLTAILDHAFVIRGVKIVRPAPAP